MAKPFKIFAHRGLWSKNKEENSLEAIEKAFKAGFDLETDVRINKGRFVIKHDPILENEKLPFLEDVLRLLKKYPNREIAFHFKYGEWQKSESLNILEILKPFADRIFIFDISSDYCSVIKKINPAIKTAVSVGDKKYHNAFYDLETALDSEDIDIIWADEYRNFYSKDLIERCHQAGKLVYAISPDLAKPVGHPRANRGYEKTWQDLIRWGADGICTDYPDGLTKIL